MDRRGFLKFTGKSAALLGFSDVILDMLLAELKAAPKAFASGRDPVVVAIQLSGGNDGLNTLIPYGNGAYFDNRPTLGYRESEVIPINGQVGLHPSLKKLKKMFDENNLAIVQGVGYPKPDLSHFRSMEVWQTGSPDAVEPTGWLGRYIDSVNKDRYPLRGLSVGSSSKIFLSKNNDIPTVNDLWQFRFIMDSVNNAENLARTKYFENMYADIGTGYPKAVGEKGIRALEASSSLNAGVTFDANANKDSYPPKNYCAEQLKFIAQCLSSNLATSSYFMQIGGFDEHSDEKSSHIKLMSQLDDLLYGFYDDLKKREQLDRVVVLVYSEFGRRVGENANGGTDHGTAGVSFAFGGKVKGGLYGEYPSLTKLDYGNFIHTVDYRSLYATVLDKWLGVSSKDILLGKSFETIPFI